MMGSNDQYQNQWAARLALLGLTFFAMINNDVLKSVNGTTWTTSKTGISDAKIYGTLAVSPTGLYLFNNGSDNGIPQTYFTTDGSLWSATSPVAFTFPQELIIASWYVREIRLASATGILARHGVRWRFSHHKSKV